MSTGGHAVHGFVEAVEKEVDQKFQANSNGQFPYPEEHLLIENNDVSAAEAAASIIAHFDLSAGDHVSSDQDAERPIDGLVLNSSESVPSVPPLRPALTAISSLSTDQLNRGVVPHHRIVPVWGLIYTAIYTMKEVAHGHRQTV